MTLEISLALLAFSAPITAAIISFAPKREEKQTDAPDFYVTTREFDNFRNELRANLAEIQNELALLNEHLT